MTNKTLGVIIGRFQVPALHAGHEELILEVASRHDHLLILVGASKGLPNLYNPLPVDSRIDMIKDWLAATIAKPHTIASIYGHPDDSEWSKAVDAKIFETKNAAGVFGEVILYGSRGSFVPHYSGIYPTKSLGTSHNIEGRNIRNRTNLTNSLDFRKGLIYAQLQRPPISYQTVDILIFDEDHTNILLGQKQIDNGKWRLPGGFVDPSDVSLEAAARREVREEMNNIEISEPRYLGSERINDYRYREGGDKILTSIFACTFLYGSPAAADDLDAVQWFPFNAALLEHIHPVHRPIIERAFTALGS